MTPGGEPMPVPASGHSAARGDAFPGAQWRNRRRSVLAAVTFFNGFDTMAMAAVLPLLAPLWKLTAAQTGVLIAAGLAGRLLGGIVFGWIADRYGRVTALTVSTGSFAGLSFACAFAWNYEVLVTLQALQGIGLGAFPVAAVYLVETAAERGRGRYALLHQVAFPAGIIAASAFALWIAPRIGWQYVFVIGSLPAMLALFLRRLLEESPRWPPSRVEAAPAIEASHAPPKTLEEKETPSAEQPPDPGTQHCLWHDFIGPQYWQRTLVVWVIWLSASLLVYGVAIWLPDLPQPMLGLTPYLASQYGLILQVAGLLGVLAATLTIDLAGRRLLLSVAFAGAALALLALYLEWPISTERILVQASTAYFFAGAFAGAVYVYTPELYPTRVRALATGIAAAWLPIALLAGALLTGISIAGGPASLLLLFAGVGVGAAIVTWLFAVETSGRALDDISP